MIRLDSLTMKNFCQHRLFFRKFGTGVVGLTGDLGSGKSNALYAIRATLTDDFRALGTKESCINWVCPNKAPSYIEAAWNLHGTEVTIRRSLRPNESTLTYKTTGEIIEGKANVSEALRRLVGIDERVLVNYVFVEQWQTFAFMSQQPAERAKLFSYLCGTEELAVIYKLLSEAISKDSQLAPEIDEAEEKRLKMENVRLTKYEKDLTKQIFKTKLTASKLQLKKVQEAYSAILKAGVISLKLGELTPRLANARARVVELIEQLKPVAKYTRKGLEERRLRFEVTARLFKMSETLPGPGRELHLYWDKQEGNDVSDLMDFARKLARKDFSQQQQVVADLALQVSNYRQRLAQTKLGKSVCPTCGTKLDYSTVDEHKARKMWKAFAGQHKRAAAILAEHLLAAKQAHQWLAGKEAYDKEEKECKERYKLKYAPSRSGVQEACKLMVNYETQLTRKESVEALLSDKRSLVKRLVQEEREQSMSLDQLMDEVKELRCGKDEPEIKDNLEKAARLDERLKGIRDGLATVRSSLEEIKKQQARLRGVRQKADNAVKWLEDAEYIRDIMHHTALPRDVAISRLKALTAPINRMLGQFDMDFVVKPDETLSFLVKTGSGAETTAARLSGGQKMLLAISFWLAINSVFVSDVGFLTLDEPTAGLNRGSIQSLAEVIDVFSKSARKSGRQVIVVTHENALRKVFDQCIELPPV